MQLSLSQMGGSHCFYSQTSHKEAVDGLYCHLFLLQDLHPKFCNAGGSSVGLDPW